MQPRHYLRLTIPKKGPFIQIPMTNGTGQVHLSIQIVFEPVTSWKWNEHFVVRYRYATQPSEKYAEERWLV